MARAKKDNLDEVAVDYYSTPIIAKKTSLSTEEIRREIQSGALRAERYKGVYRVRVRCSTRIG